MGTPDEMEVLYNTRFIIYAWGKNKKSETNPDNILLKLKCDNTDTEIEFKDLLINSLRKDRLYNAFKNKEHIQIWITTDGVNETAHQRWLKEQENIGQE